MYQIMKKFTFEAAHALEKSYSSECRNIHGHSYVVEFVMSSAHLNADGMVLDFKKFKEMVGKEVNKWDHKLLIFEDARTPVNNSLPVPFNPTAENMAKHFFDVGEKALKHIYKLGDVREQCANGVGRRVFMVSVRVWETETCYAEYIG